MATRRRRRSAGGVAGFVPTLYADAFTGGVLVRPAPAPMTDGVHSWTEFGGALYVRSAAGTLVADAANPFTSGRVTTTNSPNQTVQMTVVTRTRGPNLLFRYVDASNFLLAGWEWALASNTFRIWKVVGGVLTVLATSGVTTHPNGDIVKVTVNAANLITFFRNGVAVPGCSVTDATHAAGLGAGIGGECNSDEVDDWSCQT